MSGVAAALAYSGLGVEICGVESDPLLAAQVRVFVGSRYRGCYFTLTGADAEQAKRDWAASFCGHLLIHRDHIPVPLFVEQLVEAGA